MDEAHDLWTRYKSTNDQALRDQLILRYASFVNKVVARLAPGLPNHIARDDLVQWGLLGMIDAIDRFDPNYGAKFETFASPRVRGAVIDELRRLDWVPRSVRARARQIQDATTELQTKLGRLPTPEEIAARVGISVEEYQESLEDVGRSHIANLDQTNSGADGEDEVSLLDTVANENADDPLAALDEAVIRQVLATGLHNLPPREKMVCALYYFEELSGREIAEVLGMTTGRISQLMSAAAERLKAQLIAAQGGSSE